MRSLFIIFLYASSFVSFGQINESDTSTFQLQTRLSGSIQSGNVELVRILGSLDVSSRLNDHFVFKSQNNYLLQKFSGFKADEDVFSRNFFYYKPERKIYPYAIGFISTNFRREIEQRAFLGGGLTYQLIRRPGHNLKLSGNGNFERTRFEEADYNKEQFNGNQQIDQWMYSLYITGFHSIIKNELSLVYEGYWQQGFEESDISRYHFLIGVNLVIWKGLAMQSRINYTYENLIVESNRQKDLLWTWGLNYHYKKG
ncbi:MAG: DUF481 domain-containing protein [Cyclobacteriaceae bacterium]